MTKKCGYVALVGAPNAGKSTLLNLMVGSKIAIVTPKVQTTRNRIIGISIHNQSQMVFVDTPGVFAAKEKFEKAMVKSAIDGARDADIIALMVDSYRGLCDNTKYLLEAIAKNKAESKILLLNKVDKVEKEKLLQLAEQMFSHADFDTSFMISAKNDSGVDDVKNYLASHLPDSPWLYPEDQMTDVAMRDLAAEITREKLFMRLREELPYSIAIETEGWEEKPNGSIKISQIVYVRTEGQKKIVLGAKGQMLKSIGQSSRADISKLMGCKIHLFLFVKIAENWKNNKEFYQNIGLEY